jgi:hypothetical protein
VALGHGDSYSEYGFRHVTSLKMACFRRFPRVSSRKSGRILAVRVPCCDAKHSCDAAGLAPMLHMPSAKPVRVDVSSVGDCNIEQSCLTGSAEIREEICRVSTII